MNNPKEECRIWNIIPREAFISIRHVPRKLQINVQVNSEHRINTLFWIIFIHQLSDSITQLLKEA